MSTFEAKLSAAIRHRFAGRETVAATEACSRYWRGDPDLTDEQIVGALSVLENVFGVPGGCLRPEDSLSLLLEPPESLSFLDRLVYEVRFGDRQMRLHELVEDRLATFATRTAWPAVSTVHDFVRAWNGHLPRHE